jgi:hypothetical protein
VPDQKPLSEASVVAAQADVVSCDLVGAAALLDLQTSTYYTLNEVGSRIWNLIQQPTAVSDICEDVLSRYEVDSRRCYDDVLALLRNLDDAGLIEIVEPDAAKASRAEPV